MLHVQNASMYETTDMVRKRCMVQRSSKGV